MVAATGTRMVAVTVMQMVAAMATRMVAVTATQMVVALAAPTVAETATQMGEVMATEVMATLMAGTTAVMPRWCTPRSRPMTRTLGHWLCFASPSPRGPSGPLGMMQ